MIYIGEVSIACIGVLGVIFFIREIITRALILIPILLIVILSTDFVRGVITIESGQEKIIQHVVKRIIFTVVVFLIPVTIFGVFKVFGLAAQISESESCWTYIDEVSVEEVKKLTAEYDKKLEKERESAINEIVKSINMKVKDKEKIRTIIYKKATESTTTSTTTQSSSSEESSGSSTTDSNTKKGKPKAVIVVDDKDDKDAKRVKGAMEDYGFEVDIKTNVDKIDTKDYDTLVIPGGHNIDPKIYGAKRDEATYGTDIDKDRLQIKAVKKFKKAGKPILGICRGQQLVNVALGGTIIQDLPKPKNGWHKGERVIKNKNGSLMRDTFGAEVKTYHSHHQAIKKLGDGLYITSEDKDGTIEAVQHESLPIYAVQWHPDKRNTELRKENGSKFFKAYKKIVQQYM